MGMAAFLVLVIKGCGASFAVGLFPAPFVPGLGGLVAGRLFCRLRFKQVAQAGAPRTLLEGEEEAADSRKIADLAATAAAWAGLVLGHNFDYPTVRREIQ
jgi:hypothetical protein